MRVSTLHNEGKQEIDQQIFRFPIKNLSNSY